MGIKGDHSARKKGDNGNADPKASGMTTESTEGPHKGAADAPDSSRKTVISSA
jgi:hypothetical protein